MQLFAGIDGGGTTTRAVIADQEGKILGLGIAEPSSLGATSPSQRSKNIALAIQSALDPGGLEPSALTSLFLGVASVITEADCEAILEAVNELPSGRPKYVGVDHDIRIALEGGLAGREGIALISGTGSSCYGRRKDGRSWQSGGWEYLLDDAGSGYALAIQGLRAVVRAVDGRSAETRLTTVMLETLDIHHVPDLVRRLHFGGLSGHSEPMSKTEIASLAPLVLLAAEQGDEVAQQILRQAIGELATMVQTVSRKLEFSTGGPEIICAGSIANCEAIHQPLCEAICERLPSARFAKTSGPPVLGAVMLAMKQAGESIGGVLLKNLQKTTPQELSHDAPS